jgi:hypothetical protein
MHTFFYELFGNSWEICCACARLPLKLENFPKEITRCSWLLYICERLFNLYNFFAWDKDKVKCTLRFQCIEYLVWTAIEYYNLDTNKKIFDMLNLQRGPWRGKMGTGICLFLGWKMGFHALGLGFISIKTIENGNGIKIWAGQPQRWWDLCSGTMGFSQNLGWEMGIRPPPPPPPSEPSAEVKPIVASLTALSNAKQIQIWVQTERSSMLIQLTFILN